MQTFLQNFRKKVRRSWISTKFDIDLEPADGKTFQKIDFLSVTLETLEALETLETLETP